MGETLRGHGDEASEQAKKDEQIAAYETRIEGFKKLIPSIEKKLSAFKGHVVVQESELNRAEEDLCLARQELRELKKL